jgi:hypothetical protein
LTRSRDAAADAAAILLFTTLGLLSHGFEPIGYLRDAVPFLACWLAVGLALGLYRRGGWGRLLATWAVAIPLGVLLRALVLGRDLDGDQLAFGAVTLGFSLFFVVVLRLLAASVP